MLTLRVASMSAMRPNRSMNIACRSGSKGGQRTKHDVLVSSFRQRVCVSAVFLVGALDRHCSTGLPLAALYDNPHTTGALLAASSRVCYHLSANDSTTPEPAAHRGSVSGVMALIQSGLSVHAVKSTYRLDLTLYVQLALLEGPEDTDGSSLDSKF